MMSVFESMDLDELQSYFSDFYKDFYGFRPRFATAEQWNSSEWLIIHIQDIHDVMENMKTTPEGRAQLRYEGWSINESDYA
jgi:hypothetical protein